jgi:hypothetical protein
MKRANPTRNAPILTTLLAGAALLAGCAPPLPPPEPRGQLATGAATVSDGGEVLSPAVWSEEAYDPAERHLRHAARNRVHQWEHDRLAPALERFEEGACSAFLETTRPMCPMFGEIASVDETDGGVSIQPSDEVPLEAMMEHMRCHVEFASANDGPLAPSCPLYVPGVRVGREDGAIVLVGIDEAASREVQRRARLGRGF